MAIGNGLWAIGGGDFGALKGKISVNWKILFVVNFLWCYLLV